MTKGRMMAAMALAAMGLSALAAPMAAARTTTLTFYLGFGSGGDQVAMKNMVKKFEAENPDIKINIMTVAWADAPSKFLTMTAAGKPPDVLSMGMSQWDIASKNCFVDLYPYIKADRISLAGMHDPSIEAYEYAGGKKLYGYPFGVNAAQVMYNRTLFDKGGVNHPTGNWEDSSWTWDALLESAKKLTRDNNGDGKVDQWGIQAPLDDWNTPWTFGGAWLNKERTKVIGGSPESIKGWQFMQDLNLKHRVQGGDFLNGKTAMVKTGTWDLPTYRKIKNFKWNAAPIPFGTGDVKNRANHFYPDALVMSSIKYRKESWRFIKWIMRNQENYRYYCWDVMGMIPTVQADRKFYIEKVKTAEDGIDWDVIVDAPKYAQIQRAFLISEWGEFRDALPSGLAPLWSGKQSPEQVLKSLVPKLQSIVDRAKR